MAYINSIQQVSISLGSGVSSNTATINAVGANAFIIYQGFNTTEALDNLELDEFPKLVLTNTTTVTASRSTSTTGVTVVNAVVIDPTSSLVTSVQAGTITLAAATSNTATITSVDTTLSAVFLLGFTTTGATVARTFCGVTLTNATTVTATCGSAISTEVVSFVVVTFAAGAINSIQQISNTSTANVNDDSVTITSVVTGNTMLAYGGYTTTASGTAPQSIRAQKLTDATHVDFISNSVTTNSRTDRCTVIEFKSGVLRQATQRGSITQNSTTTAAATITNVQTANAFCNFTGWTTANALSRPDEIYNTLALTNATTITATQITSVAGNTLVYYEAVEFVPNRQPYFYDLIGGM